MPDGLGMIPLRLRTAPATVAEDIVAGQAWRAPPKREVT
jgi:hypothetical protein